MPLTVIPSGKPTVKKCKRRQDENVVINELASLVPLSTPLISCDSSSGCLVPSSGNKPPITSVLRLTSSYIKLQNFLKSSTTSPVNRSSDEYTVSSDNIVGRIEEAIDGFLIILDKDANILYVSTTIAGHVGLLQQDVIGMNLTKITRPQFSPVITDSLKPSSILRLSTLEECVISQHRQFRIRFDSNASNLTCSSDSIVQVQGTLKVKLSKNEDDTNLEPVEPSVVGFVGECRVVEAMSSILEISFHCSTFTVTRTLDMQKFISIDSTAKQVIGYDPEVLLRNEVNFIQFLHPADPHKLISQRNSLMQTGHAVSPHVRLLASSGDWVWMQTEAFLRYKSGTSIPQFWEIKIRVKSDCGGRLSSTQQRELYTSESDKEPSFHDITPRFNCQTNEGAKTRSFDSLGKNKLPIRLGVPGGPPEGMPGCLLGTHHRPPGVFGHPPGVFGRPPGVLGRPPGVFGPPPGIFGGPPGVFGQPPGIFGGPPGVFGQPPGQSVHSLGLPGYPSDTSRQQCTRTDQPPCMPGCSSADIPGPSPDPPDYHFANNNFSRVNEFSKNSSTVRVVSAQTDQASFSEQTFEPFSVACYSSPSLAGSLLSNTTSPTSSTSLSQMSPQVLSSHDSSSALQLGTSHQVNDNLGNTNTTDSEFPPHGLFHQQQHEGIFDSNALREQNRIHSTPLAVSSGTSNPSLSSTSMATTEQDMDPEQFLNHPVNSINGSWSTTCTTYGNSTFRELHLQDTVSQEVKTLLPNSNPLSTPAPFLPAPGNTHSIQSSSLPNPQANEFTPSGPNFSYNSSSPNKQWHQAGSLQTSEPGFLQSHQNASLLHSQSIDHSHPTPNNGPTSPFTQQLLYEMLEDSIPISDTSFSETSTIPSHSQI